MSKNTVSYFFATDLHGSADRYRKLLAAIAVEKPAAVLLGGDLLPTGTAQFSASMASQQDFVADYLTSAFTDLRDQLGPSYPRVLLILGNDDARAEESAVVDGASSGLWEYIHDRKAEVESFSVYGYTYVPPTPFLLKDWERYDVSRYVDPGCVSPEEGFRSVPITPQEAKYSTIQEDLERLTEGAAFDQSIFLFHSPPHKTLLDRAALDGKMVEHVPLDVHIGSIAIRRFIEKNQPLLTLHGHVHESARITGSWKDRIGQSVMLSAAHDGPELALVRFDPRNPAAATRDLL